MEQYLCAWEIEVMADTPEEAAGLAEKAATARVASAWTVTDSRGIQVSVTVKEAE